jgi:uncharacterized protein (DUF2235 family)
MGVILNCGKESLYISLLNWSNFKMYVLFLTFQIIGKLYPDLFIFIDERLEIFERIDNFESITNFKNITNFESMTELTNIHTNKLILFPSIFIEYVNDNKNNVHNMELTGVHDLLNNTAVYDCNHCKNIFIALKVLRSHMTLTHTQRKEFNKINSMFEHSWTNKQDLYIL